jgi:prepilin signal peptidase PulO-like enzyme (type II secretory pathway)
MNLEILYYIFIFILGLCIGSFLNCVIYRLETKKTLKGRSFCPKCKKQLKWQDLIPVFSFLFLKGKCRNCKQKISIQYPLVELATGIIFVLIFNRFGVLNYTNILFWLYISTVLIIIFVYDLKHYEIPDKILIPAIIITFIFCILFNFSLILNYLLAVLIGFGFFFSIFYISAGKWMGFGDVKFAILMGLLLGVSNILLALFLAFFFGAIIGIILLIYEKKGLKSEIPFGPFLILGTFISILWGSQIINWYFSFIV